MVTEPSAQSRSAVLPALSRTSVTVWMTLNWNISRIVGCSKVNGAFCFFSPKNAFFARKSLTFSKLAVRGWIKNYTNLTPLPLMSRCFV